VTLEYPVQNLIALDEIRNGSFGIIGFPASAEVFTKQKGHYSRQEHDFSNFMLFSTSATEKVGAPPTPKDDHPERDLKNFN
jgi:hypothetical protein